jgi:predicted GNAT family N-acyltransferase
MDIRIREIQHGSAAYDEEVELRMEILRRPLGIGFDPAQLAAENTDIHLGAYDGGKLVACLVLTPHDAQSMRMRQVAVANDYQRKGVGRILVARSESIAKEKGYRQMVLHARETAIPFYISMDYLVEREPFIEVGIPHRYMTKNLL